MLGVLVGDFRWHSWFKRVLGLRGRRLPTVDGGVRMRELCLRSILGQQRAGAVVGMRVVRRWDLLGRWGDVVRFVRTGLLLRERL